MYPCVWPQVYGVEWNPFAVTHRNVPHGFLTFGKKHIKAWVREGAGWAGKPLSVGRLDMQHVHSAAWLPPRAEGSGECLIVAGMNDGQLYIFKVGAVGHVIYA
jgi:microtubule-associated protein-like 6